LTQKSASGNGGEEPAKELDDPNRFKVAKGLEDLPVEDLGDGITLERLYPPDELAALRTQLTDDAIEDLTSKEAHRKARKILGIEESPPLDFAPIEAGCAWLREVHETGGKDESEPLWHDAIRCTTYMENGNTIAHQLSNKHEGYDSKKTEEKYDLAYKAK